MKKTSLMIIFCLCFSFLFSACSENSEKKQTTNVYRYDRTSVTELTDGWFLFCDYEEIYNSDGTYLNTYCTLDGMNLKYQDLSDFNVAITNSKTGEITGYITPSVNGFCMNENYNEKLTKVSEYLKNRDSKTVLSEEELSFIDIDNMIFKKNDIVNVYNDAMKNTVDSKNSGEYLYISFSDIRKGALIGDYHWQVGYLIFTGNIAAINIELIYSDGKYLSDIDSSKLTEQQIALISEIEKTENYIIKQQTFIPSNFNFNKSVDGVEFSKLHEILNSIEVENETNKNIEN